jgi:hypothetical protein
MTLPQMYRTISIAITGVLVAAALATTANAQTNMSTSVKNIVFVHGARADGSYWSKAIPCPRPRNYTFPQSKIH